MKSMRSLYKKLFHYVPDKRIWAYFSIADEYNCGWYSKSIKHVEQNLESDVGILTAEAILLDVLFVLFDRVNQSFVILYSYTEDFYDLHSSDIFYCCRTHFLKRR